MHIRLPLPLPGVPGDLEVGLLGLVDFRFTFVSAIQALLCLKENLACHGPELKRPECINCFGLAFSI